MFGLFKSPRQKLKASAEKAFKSVLPALRGMTGEEIAFVLDQAKRIKSATTVYGSDQQLSTLFRDPLLSNEEFAFDNLSVWLKHMKSIGNTTEGQAQVASLSIWWLSVASIRIAELRVLGKALWKELSRAYPYTTDFDPEEDCVIGLESHAEANCSCTKWASDKNFPDGHQIKHIQILLDMSHDLYELYLCDACQQHYLRQWHEDVDWSGGDDSSWSTIFPINDEQVSLVTRFLDEGLRGQDLLKLLNAIR